MKGIWVRVLTFVTLLPYSLLLYCTGCIGKYLYTAHIILFYFFHLYLMMEHSMWKASLFETIPGNMLH